MSAMGSPASRALRQRVERRLVYALTRFGSSVERVAVQLADEENPLGGLDTRCRMRARLRNGEIVAVETLDGWAAVDRASDRLVARIELALGDGQAALPPVLVPLAVPEPEQAKAAGGSARRKGRRPMPRRRGGGR